MASRARVTWPELLLTSGLAATIGALGLIGSDAIKQYHQSGSDRCAMAKELLQDDRWNPYLEANAGKQIAAEIGRRVRLCMKE